MLKPFSNWKIAFMPPPRSSAPFSPQREPDRLPDTSRVCAPPALVLLRCSMPTSAMPYSVTLLCACAAPQVRLTPAAASAPSIRREFVLTLWLAFLNSMESPNSVYGLVLNAWITPCGLKALRLRQRLEQQHT